MPPSALQTAPDETTTQRSGTDHGEARSARTIRYVFLFVLPFIMVSMMFATYVGTMHSPHPRDLPIAVVGTGAEADAAAGALDAIADDAIYTRRVGTEAEARDLLAARDVAGALEVAGDGSGRATIYVASAAGPSQVTTVQQVLAPLVVENAWTVTTQDVAPLPAGDSSGTAALFAAMGMMLGGYVPLSLMLLSVPHLLPLRRFLPVLAGWAALTSTVIWLIMGPLVGAIDAPFLQVLGVGMLTVAAVGLTQLLFVKILGPFAVVLGMAVFVVLGMPASNLALSVDVMPGFFSFMHGVLPLPAAGEALRSLLYFDGAGVGRHLLTLALWLLVSGVLCLLKERSSGPALPATPLVLDADTPLPALAGGPVRSKGMRYAAAIAFPLSIMVMVVGLMSFSMHQPTVTALPVAVVAPTLDEAREVASGLQDGLGDMIDARPSATLAEATQAIRDGDVTGALVLGQAEPGEVGIYTSSAAGPSQQSVVRAVVQGFADSQGMAVSEHDVVALTDTDTMGSNSLYFGMSWVMAGFLMMAVLRGGAPELKTLRQYLPLLGGWAIGMSVWLWLLFDVIIGAVSGHAWEMIGMGALTIFAVSLATAVFTRTVGMAAIVPVMAVLMLAGVPASGGGISLYMVPEVFRTLNDILPLPAAVEAARSFVYFDGAGVASNVAVILAWAAVAVVLNLGVDHLVARRGGRSAAVEASEPALIGGGSGEGVAAR